MLKKRKLSDLKNLEQPTNEIANQKISTDDFKTKKNISENKTNLNNATTKDLTAFFEDTQKPASVIFSLYIDINTHKELKELSKKTGVKVNRIIAQFIKDGLNRLKK